MKDLEIVSCANIEEISSDFNLLIASFGYLCVAPDFELFGNLDDSRSKESFSHSLLEIEYRVCDEKD